MASLALLSRGCWRAVKSPSFLRALSTSSVKLGGGGPATSSLGGPFVENPGTPPSQEEISKWVEKEMEGNWQSYGYDYHDQKIDAQKNMVWMFALISLGMVLTIMVHAHQPDRRQRDWAIREAYLLLREREAAGVEPLSRDLVDPQKILDHLPSDEELKEMGVVINL